MTSGVKMRIEVDTHTHTVLSGHAHSTILENAAAAKKNGLKGLVMTDHGPSIPSAPPDFNINTYGFIPEKIHGIRIYRGIESNIISAAGNIDIQEKFLKKLDYVIAGMHEIVMPSGGIEKDTEAAIGALNNKYVDIISHPDNPSYMIDYEVFIKETSRLGKLIELNDHSLEYRKGGIENARILLGICKRLNVRIAVSSDAHFALCIGKVDKALELIRSESFPEELIVNLKAQRFEDYLKERTKRISVDI